MCSDDSKFVTVSSDYIRCFFYTCLCFLVLTPAWIKLSTSWQFFQNLRHNQWRQWLEEGCRKPALESDTDHYAITTTTPWSPCNHPPPPPDHHAITTHRSPCNHPPPPPPPITIQSPPTPPITMQSPPTDHHAITPHRSPCNHPPQITMQSPPTDHHAITPHRSPRNHHHHPITMQSPPTDHHAITPHRSPRNHHHHPITMQPPPPPPQITMQSPPQITMQSPPQITMQSPHTPDHHAITPHRSPCNHPPDHHAITTTPDHHAITTTRSPCNHPTPPRSPCNHTHPQVTMQSPPRSPCNHPHHHPDHHAITPHRSPCNHPPQITMQSPPPHPRSPCNHPPQITMQSPPTDHHAITPPPPPRSPCNHPTPRSPCNHTPQITMQSHHAITPHRSPCNHPPLITMQSPPPPQITMQSPPPHWDHAWWNWCHSDMHAINRDLAKTQMVTVMLRGRPRTKEWWLLVGAGHACNQPRPGENSNGDSHAERKATDQRAVVACWGRCCSESGWTASLACPPKCSERDPCPSGWSGDPRTLYTHQSTKANGSFRPNSKRFKQMLNYFNRDTPYAHFQGNPLYQATKQLFKFCFVAW